MDSLFRHLGLDAKETRTFLKLLELGAQPVSIVAKHVGVPRTTMYFILERLKSAQLIEEFERSGIKYMKCIPVQSIGNLLKLREKKVRQTLSIFEEYLPQLRAMENAKGASPTVKFAEGTDAVSALYESLACNSDCRIITDLSAITQLHDYGTIGTAIAGRSKQPVRELVVNTPEARRYKKDTLSKNHHIKLLPGPTAFASHTFIFHERVCMISFGNGQVTGIDIHSPNVAQTQRALFDHLWETTESN